MLNVKAVTLPSNIVGLKPAQIGVCQLQDVYFPGVGHSSLNPAAARAWNAMVVAMAAPPSAGGAGITLTAVSLADVLRTYDTQVRAFNARYTVTYTEGINVKLGPGVDGTRVWNGVTYYLLAGKIPCAVPGQGYHPLGLAVDVAIWAPTVSQRPINIRNARFGTAWPWLLANADSFGWSWENVHEGVDDSHLHYWAGDNVPQRVLDVEMFILSHQGGKV